MCASQLSNRAWRAFKWVFPVKSIVGLLHRKQSWIFTYEYTYERLMAKSPRFLCGGKSILYLHEAWGVRTWIMYWTVHVCLHTPLNQILAKGRNLLPHLHSWRHLIDLVVGLEYFQPMKNRHTHPWLLHEWLLWMVSWERWPTGRLPHNLRPPQPTTCQSLPCPFLAPSPWRLSKIGMGTWLPSSSSSISVHSGTGGESSHCYEHICCYGWPQATATSATSFTSRKK